MHELTNTCSCLVPIWLIGKRKYTIHLIQRAWPVCFPDSWYLWQLSRFKISEQQAKCFSLTSLGNVKYLFIIESTFSKDPLVHIAFPHLKIWSILKSYIKIKYCTRKNVLMCILFSYYTIYAFLTTSTQVAVSGKYQMLRCFFLQAVSEIKRPHLNIINNASLTGINVTMTTRIDD